jgi:hypothetical protein
VHKIAPAGLSRSEAEVPTDLLAGLLMERVSASSPTTRNPDSLPPKVYAVMALTTLLTFGTLTAGYQLLFAHQLFA